MLGVLIGAQACAGEAVPLAGVAEPAVEEQISEDVAEVLSAVDADQPGGGEAGAPVVPQQQFEFVVIWMCDVMEGWLSLARIGRPFGGMASCPVAGR